MEKVKKCIGVDISKKDFTACMSWVLNENMSSSKTTTFSNTKSGFTEMFAHFKPEKDTLIVMEATGSYFEHLAYYCHELGYRVQVILPNKIKSYMDSFNRKAKTDNIDSHMISVYGIDRSHLEFDWTPLSTNELRLKQKSRELRKLIEEQTRIKVYLSTLKDGFDTDKSIIRRFERIIRFMDAEIKKCRKEFEKYVMKETEYAEKINRVCEIEGVGKSTIYSLLAETQFFKTFQTGKQLVSYSGYDIKVHQSGTLTKRGKISKRGNSRIRQLMFMPSLTALRCNSAMRTFYQRLIQKGKNGKSAQIAVARKLLILIFTIWKTDRKYDPLYYKNMAKSYS